MRRRSRKLERLILFQPVAFLHAGRVLICKFDYGADEDSLCKRFSHRGARARARGYVAGETQ